MKREPFFSKNYQFKIWSNHFFKAELLFLHDFGQVYLESMKGNKQNSFLDRK